MLRATPDRLALLASLVTAAAGAACGGSGTDRPPAGGDGGIDAAVDAPPDAPPPTRVRVTVNSGGQPASGVAILFQRPDDSVAADVETDFKGVAEAELPTGGNVSLLAPSTNGSRVVIAYLGVKGGDVLEIGAPYAPEKTPVGPVTLQLPTGTASTYFVTSRCRFDNFNAAVAQVEPCGTPTNFLVTNDGKSFYTDQLSLTTGQTVDLTASVYRPRRTITLRALNAPQPQFSFHSANTVTRDLGISLSVGQQRNLAVPGGDGEVDFDIADLPNAKVISDIAFSPAAGFMHWYRRGLPKAIETFDFTQAGIPFVSGRTYANNTLSWTETGGSGGDLVFAYININNPSPTLRLRIHVVGPKTGTSLRIPVFPAKYDEYNAKAGDAASIFRAGVARTTGGYDAARRYGHRNDFLLFDWLEGDWVASE